MVRVMGRIRAGRSWFTTDVKDRIRRIEAAPPITQEGDTIRVGRVDDDWLFRNISINYDVTVPLETQVLSRTGSGSQTISDLSGPVDVTAGSGRLVLRNISSDVRASTGSGDIQVENLGGSFAAHAGSGRITAEAVQGAVNARTGTGGIDVMQTGEADVDVVTGSGRIGVKGARRGLRVRAGGGSIELEGRPGQNWNVESGSGSIRVVVPADAAFELNARTASGTINTSHPLADIVVRAPTHVRGTVRGGASRIELSTASGSIHVD